MKDHETALMENKRGELLKEHRELEEELFKRMPLKEKIHTYFFAMAYVGAILFGLWLLGYIIYVFIARRA